MKNLRAATYASIVGRLVAFVLVSSPLSERAASPPDSRFTLQQRGQECWLVKPDGRRFFSLGVCCVNQGIPVPEWDSANPGYASWKQYADSNTWAVVTLERLKAWGFTTLGGWSDFQTLQGCSKADFAFAPVLHLGATAGAPWWDMWDP